MAAVPDVTVAAAGLLPQLQAALRL
jgi:hypothetical protein